MTKIHVERAGDRLRILAPRGAITPEVKRKLIAAKPVLMVFAPADVYIEQRPKEQRA